MTENPAIDPRAAIGKNVTISPLAVIGPNVTIEDGVTIDPFAQIGASVRPGDPTRIHIGRDCHIGGAAQIMGMTAIGAGCTIGPGALLGGQPQAKGYAGEPTELIIGERNFIGEYATIHRGTQKGGGRTVIGNDNYIMGECHIAHDCQLGNNITMANKASLAGHVQVGDCAYIYGMAGVQPFVRIGKHAMVAAGAGVTGDILPYTITDHDTPARHRGINIRGLEMQPRAFSRDTIRTLRETYKTLFDPERDYSAQLKRLQENLPGDPTARHFIECAAALSQNGVAASVPKAGRQAGRAGGSD